jgi:transposase InsO family protein
MVGPLRQALEDFTHLLVVVDKFSKWIEARPIVNVCSEEAVSFFTDIIYQFGIPNTIITDNGTQFTGKKFLNFCDDNHIRVDWSVVAHRKRNEQVERANGMILQDLKPKIFKRLDKFRARWVAELSSVLWSLRTTASWATGFTPFFMVHGSVAVLPIDIDYDSPRVRAYTEEGNQVALEDVIDQLDEARDVALLRSAKYQQALRHYHERNMRPREFHVGDLVLRRVQGSKDRHKLSPPWEGPFIIHEVLRLGTYKIQYEDGRVVTNAWNIEHLRPFYPSVNVQNSCVNKYMLLAFVHMSLSSKFIFVCVHFSLWQRLSLSRQRLCTKAKTLPARGLPRARCPLRFFEIFQKIPTTLSRPITQVRGFSMETQT